MFKEFKEFAVRGSVLDLEIGPGESRDLLLRDSPRFQEALAALAFFRLAAEAETAGAELVARIAYLRRAEGNPGLRFEDPA